MRTCFDTVHRRFRIGPPQVSLNLLPPEFHRRGILLTIANMKEKQLNNIFVNRMVTMHKIQAFPVEGLKTLLVYKNAMFNLMSNPDYFL